MSNVSHVYPMASIFIVGAGELTDVSDYREHNRKPAGQDDIICSVFVLFTIRDNHQARKY